MDLLLAFAIILLLMAVAGIRYRISPFFTLVGGAILFGLLTGSDPDAILIWIAAGIGRIVTSLGIIIFCGAIIAKILRDQHLVEDIVSDIRCRIRNPVAISGISGYILAVPLGCCITAFLILSPILKHLGRDEEEKRIFLYLAAIGGVISFVLIYPTPVLIPLFMKFAGGLSPVMFDAITIPFSMIILAGAVTVAVRYRGKNQPSGTVMQGTRDDQEAGSSFHLRAWMPFIIMMAAIPAGFFIFGLSHGSLINLVMLSGVATAILISPVDGREQSIKKGAMHGGLVIFDICGAGALGYVILQKGLAESLLNYIPDFMPIIIIPFLTAALIATAQGSRVVTAVITADLFAGTALAASVSPVSFILAISAGACIVSFVTDPYFWLVQHSTGDEPAEVLKYYTIPLAIVGLIIFAVAVLLDFFIF